jgi:LacI family transcriptional regulator
MSIKRPTLKDVAKVAGVSVTTASYVVNGQSGGNIRISDDTRDRVCQAAKDLDYHPNLAARHTRTGHSGLIGFISDEIASTPFAVNIIRGAQQAARKNGKTLFVINTERDRQAEKQAMAALLERRVEGIVYATMYHRTIQPHQTFHKVPTVLVDCFSEDRSLPSITPDEVQGGRLATEVLLAKGHRRIGFINVDFERHAPAAAGRLEGYRQALAAYGVPFEDDLVRIGNTMADSGYLQTLELLVRQDRPTAIFCSTDRMAMGAYDALKESGLRIPEDISIIGFDNQELIAAYLRPALSTIALPHYEMGRWAIEHLLEHPQVPPEAPVQHRIACPLVKRASV